MDNSRQTQHQGVALDELIEVLKTAVFVKLTPYGLATSGSVRKWNRS